MTQPIQLEPIREWSRRDETLPAAAQADLIRHGGKALAINSTGRTGEVTLSTNHHVGAISTPTVRLIVNPKIDVENLLYLLEPTGRAISVERPAIGWQTHQGIVPAFATFVAATIERATGRGLLRSYRPEEDRLLALRGRIDLRRHLASGVATPIACRFDEHTADITENQILLACVQRLLRLPGVAMATQQLLHRQQARFAEVSNVPVDTASIAQLRFTRLNSHYEPALRLARIVLENATITDTAGDAAASVFLIDMNVVFEEFLEWRLRRRLARHLEVIGQDRSKLDLDGLVTIKPDLLFRDGGAPVFIGDAKYKRTSTGTGPESDVYQLLAYLTAYDVPEGVLVYAKEDEAPSQMIRVRNADKTIWTWPIDLTGDVPSIDRAIDDLAGWIEERTQSRRPPALALVGDATYRRTA